MPSIKQTGPYIPRADGEFRDWLNNFAAVVGQGPSAAGLAPADAVMLEELAQRYEAAYVRATSPGTRCRASVAQKNLVRKEAWRIVRPIAMRIKRNAGISDAKKLELAIRSLHRSQSPIRRPRRAPTLSIVQLGNGVHRLRFSDPDAPTRFAKPPGVTQLQLMVIISDKPARDPNGKGRLLIKTRHVFNVIFEPEDTGKIATYFVRWATQKGLAGPWSMAVSMTVVGGRQKESGETREAV